MSSATEIRRSRPLLGTFVEISARGDDIIALHAAADLAFEQIEKVQRLMSAHDEGSDVSRLSYGAHLSPISIDPWTYEVIETALLISNRSSGAFDITVGGLLKSWGYSPALPKRTGGNFHSIQLLGGSRIWFREPMAIDLGGIAKGFAVDKAIEALRSLGVESASVNAGGDVRVLGREKIQLRDLAGRLVPFLELDGEAVATSSPAISKKSVGRSEVSALIDGITRSPALDEFIVSVRASTCVIADALTKLFFCSELTRSKFDCFEVLAQFGASAYRYSDGELFVLSS